MQLCYVHHVVLSSMSLASASSASSVYSPPSNNFDHRNFVLHIYVSIPLVYAHEILGQCDMYFLNGSHLSKFHYVGLLSTWLNLEPSYLAQSCIYTGATYRGEIMHLSIIFVKLWIFKKFHILHFLAHLAYMWKILIFTFGTPRTHMYTDTHRHMQTYRHRYVDVHVGNLRKLLPEVCGSIHSECQSQHKH